MKDERGRVYGTFAIYASRPGVFDAREVAFEPERQDWFVGYVGRSTTGSSIAVLVATPGRLVFRRIVVKVYRILLLHPGFQTVPVITTGAVGEGARAAPQSVCRFDAPSTGG